MYRVVYEVKGEQVIGEWISRELVKAALKKAEITCDAHNTIKVEGIIDVTSTFWRQ
jgi:hypothetical protein